MYSFVGKTEMGRRLKKLRGNKRQSDVAKAVNITRNALANYESGIRIPIDDVKARLANYYNVPLESIFFI